MGRPGSAAAVAVRGIDHVVLRVADLERAIAFYRDVLGCDVDRRREELGLVHMRAGEALIDLVDVNGKLGRRLGAPPGKEGRNLDHVSLRLAAFEADGLRDHLAAHGVSASEVMRLYGADGYGPAIYIEDPDGNTVELKGPPEDQGQASD